MVMNQYEHIRVGMLPLCGGINCPYNKSKCRAAPIFYNRDSQLKWRKYLRNSTTKVCFFFPSCYSFFLLFRAVCNSPFLLSSTLLFSLRIFSFLTRVYQNTRIPTASWKVPILLLRQLPTTSIQQPQPQLQLQLSSILLEVAYQKSSTICSMLLNLPLLLSPVLFMNTLVTSMSMNTSIHLLLRPYWGMCLILISFSFVSTYPFP